MADWRVLTAAWAAAACLGLAACNGGTETVTGGNVQAPDTANSNDVQNDNQPGGQNDNDPGQANNQENNNNQGQDNADQDGDTQFPSPRT